MAETEPHGQTEIPQEWLSEFERHLELGVTARNAWKMLENAGLREAATLLLFGYAKGAEKDVNAANKRAANAARLLKAAARAQKIDQTKTPISSRDPDLFSRRAQNVRDIALRSDWLTPDGTVKTLGHAINGLRKEPSLYHLARGVKKAAGMRSIISNPMYFLMLLQEHAAIHGVSLGIKRLTALADCAEDEITTTRLLDEGTLGRYLRSIPQKTKEAILRDAVLPPLASHKMFPKT